MKIYSHKKQFGVTLLEVMLVMVIMSSFIVMGVGYMQQRAANLRMDRTSAQIQQILNAGLAYYVNNGTWPTKLADLVPSYFPSKPKNPWGGGEDSYRVGVLSNGTDNKSGSFFVWTSLTMGAGNEAAASATAKIIAGKLPFGYVADTTADDGQAPPEEAACTKATCTVVSFVNIPGQNLNNATAINFAGLYHHGGCVPVPSCPVDKNGNTMTPSVFIVPVSVSGVNDSPATNVYPISSFTGYATGDGTSSTPAECTGSTEGANAPACPTDPSGQKYWRACLDLITERGSLAGTDDWGQYVTLMALTRCAITDEPSGSPFTVFSD